MKINNIDTKDISVVVQGAIDKINTPICLTSIRKYLPGAEIILSTWEGSDVGGLDYDVLLLNEDPGNYISDEEYKVYNNVNRQIVSTKNGLKRATKKYAIKIGSDIEITGTNFLNYFGKFDKYEEKYKILNNRVVILNTFTRNPEEFDHIAFHPSDWFFFGLRDDVLNIWDISLQTKESAYYFKNKPRPKNDIISTWLFQYVPEQYIWKSFLEKNNHKIDFKYFGDNNKKNTEDTFRYFVNNLVVINYNSSSIFFKKYNDLIYQNNVLNHIDFLVLYKKYCDSSFCVKYQTKKIILSVVVPTHGRIDYFKETIACLANQTSNQFEVIVTDDSSKEEERKEIKNIVDIYNELGCNFKYVFTEPNLLQSKNTNQGILNTKADYVRILHSDDIISPNCIEHEINYIENNQDIELFYHQQIPFRYSDKKIANYENMKPSKEHRLLFSNKDIPVQKFNIQDFWLTSIFLQTAIPSTLIFKKSLAEKVGLMNAKYKAVCDWDFFYKMIMELYFNKKQIGFINYGYVGWRYGGDSITKNGFLSNYYEYKDFINKVINEYKDKKILSKKQFNECIYKSQKYRYERLINDYKNNTIFKQKIFLLPILLKELFSNTYFNIKLLWIILFLPLQILNLFLKIMFSTFNFLYNINKFKKETFKKVIIKIYKIINF